MISAPSLVPPDPTLPLPIGIIPETGKRDNYGCVYRGASYAHLDVWKVNECTMCSCLNGTTTCEIESCPELSCPDQEFVPGECCPHCPYGE